MASQLSGCSSQRLVLTIMSRRGDETSLETRQPSLFRHLYTDTIIQIRLFKGAVSRN